METVNLTLTETDIIILRNLIHSRILKLENKDSHQYVILDELENVMESKLTQIRRDSYYDYDII